MSLSAVEVVVAPVGSVLLVVAVPRTKILSSLSLMR